MPEKLITIELTAEQREQIKKATGVDVEVLELTAEECLEAERTERERAGSQSRGA